MLIRQSCQLLESEHITLSLGTCSLAFIIVSLSPCKERGHVARGVTDKWFSYMNVLNIDLVKQQEVVVQEVEVCEQVFEPVNIDLLPHTCAEVSLGTVLKPRLLIKAKLSVCE